MALKEPWRGNPAEKQYQFLTDFSGGKNTKIEDSLLKDNVAREIKNFDIIAGGLLSKRKGFSPLFNNQIIEFLRNYYGVSSLVTESALEQILKGKKTINSWTFFFREKTVVVQQTEKGLINFIFGVDMTGEDSLSITQTDLQTDNVIVESFAEKPVMIYFDKSDTTKSKKPFLMSWNGMNWVNHDADATVAVTSDRQQTIAHPANYKWDSLSKITRLLGEDSEYFPGAINLKVNETNEPFDDSEINISASQRIGSDRNIMSMQRHKENNSWLWYYYNFFSSDNKDGNLINPVFNEFNHYEGIHRNRNGWWPWYQTTNLDLFFAKTNTFPYTTYENKPVKLDYHINGFPKLNKLLKDKNSFVEVGKKIYERLITKYPAAKSIIAQSSTRWYIKDTFQSQLAYNQNETAQPSKIESFKNTILELEDLIGGSVPYFFYKNKTTLQDAKVILSYNELSHLDSTAPSVNFVEHDNAINTQIQSNGEKLFAGTENLIKLEFPKEISEQLVSIGGTTSYRFDVNQFYFKYDIQDNFGNIVETITINKNDLYSPSGYDLEKSIELLATKGFTFHFGSLKVEQNSKKVYFVLTISVNIFDETTQTITNKVLFAKMFNIDTSDESMNDKWGIFFDYTKFTHDKTSDKYIVTNELRKSISCKMDLGTLYSKYTGIKWGEDYPKPDNSIDVLDLQKRHISPVYRTVNYELNIPYDEVYTSATSEVQQKFNAITKYIPDAFSFKNLSYNLLALAEDQDIIAFDKATLTDFKKFVSIDGISPTPTLSSIIQVNGYFAEVNKKAIFKASLELPGTSQADADASYANYYFGWQFMPLEKYNELISKSETADVLVQTVIKPAFNNASISGKGRDKSFFEFIPQTSNPSLLICYAIDGSKFEDSTTHTLDWNKIKLADILQVQTNIVPAKTYGELFTPSEVIRDFVKVDKSIVWKNQLFLYGNSNSIFVSDVANFGYFPMLNNLQIPSDANIQSITIYYDSLIVATERQQFVITGDTPQDFKINELNDDIGVVASKSVKNNANYIFQLTADGVYLVKSLFNFRDRYNTEKVDDAVAGDIIADRNANAVVWNNKYYLNIPSKKQIWIYYNDFKAWITYESELFDLNNMFVINDELWLISNESGQMYKFSKIVEDVHGQGPYKDVNIFGGENEITSAYKSKEIDFGLPNHDKKLKKLQVRFAETPGSNQLFVKVWIDGTLKVSPDKDVITTNADGTVTKSTTTTPEITTTANSNWVGTAAGEFKSGDVTYTGNRNNVGNKHDQDTDQLHEVIVAGRGRNMQFEIVHRQNKRLNVKNFATLLKVKKPKALRTYSQKG